jgi:hypothetical protein
MKPEAGTTHAPGIGRAPSFPSLATSHATAGGIDAPVLDHLTEHGLFTRVPEALDAVLNRIGADPSA